MLLKLFSGISLLTASQALALTRTPPPINTPLPSSYPKFLKLKAEGEATVEKREAMKAAYERAAQSSPAEAKFPSAAAAAAPPSSTSLPPPPPPSDDKSYAPWLLKTNWKPSDPGSEGALQLNLRAPEEATMNDDEENAAKIEKLRTEGIERIAKRKYLADAQRILQLKMEGEERIKKRDFYAQAYAEMVKIQELTTEGEERIRRKAEIAAQYEEKKVEMGMGSSSSSSSSSSSDGSPVELKELLMTKVSNKMLSRLSK